MNESVQSMENNEKKESSIKKSVVDKCLQSIVNDNDGIYATILSSVDGHPIARHTTKDFAESRLAAMTSSCLALGERIAAESEQNGCDFVIIQNKNGLITLKRVGKKLVLTVLSDTSINMGMLLHATRTAAENLYDQID